MSKVAIIGIVGESMFMQVDTLPNAGETVHAKEMFCELGGKGFNQAIAVARMNESVSFLTAVGSDGYKAKVETFCQQENIKPFVIEKQGQTAYAVIERDMQGENRVTVFAGVTLSEKDIDTFEQEIANAEYLLITNEIPNTVLEKAIKIAYKYKTKVIFNTAPWREIAKDIKEKVWLFTPNQHENIGFEDCKNVIITMGDKGSYIKQMDITIPSEKVNAVDTTGAGDTFNGVLTAMLCKGKTIQQAVEIANRMAGKSVTKKGVVNAIPYEK